MFGPISFLALAVLITFCCIFFVWLTQRSKDRMRSVAGRASESAGDDLIEADLGGIVLAGRLDGTIEVDGSRFPVVFGPRRKPRRSDRALMLRIAAAARLFKARYGEIPSQVAVKFGDGTDMLQPVVPSLMEDFDGAVMLLVHDMTLAGEGKMPSRSHGRPDLCEKCPYFHICGDRICSAGQGT